MSYENYEESREHGSPVNIMLFRYGVHPLSVYTYTDGERPVSRDDLTYAPIPIEAGNVVSSGTMDKKTLNLMVPSNSEVALLYLAYPPSFPVTLTIMRGHYGNNGEDPTDWKAIWVGRVLNGKHEGDGSHQCVLTCEPIATSLRRTGLRRHYQYMCPHVLYGATCKANRAARTFTILPLSHSGGTIKLPAGSLPDALLSKFANGVIEWTTAAGNVEIRTVLEVELDGADYNVHMSGPDTGLVNQAVRISFGCNHQMDDCLEIHENIHNFGGMPWIPINNPIGTFYNSFY